MSVNRTMSAWVGRRRRWSLAVMRGLHVDGRPPVLLEAGLLRGLVRILMGLVVSGILLLLVLLVLLHLNLLLVLLMTCRTVRPMTATLMLGVTLMTVRPLFMRCIAVNMLVAATMCELGFSPSITVRVLPRPPRRGWTSRN